MLAVAVSARAFTADPRIEVTLSPKLQTSPLPVTPVGVADRWRNIGSCRWPSVAHRMTGQEDATNRKPNCQRTGMPLRGTLNPCECWFRPFAIRGLSRSKRHAHDRDRL